MVLRNRDIDHLIRFKDLRIERPGLEHCPVDIHVLKLSVVHIIDICTQSSRCLVLSRSGQRPRPATVHWPVEDPYLLGAGLETEFYHCSNNFRIRVPGLLWSPVPADIRFELFGYRLAKQNLLIPPMASMAASRSFFRGHAVCNHSGMEGCLCSLGHQVGPLRQRKACTSQRCQIFRNFRRSIVHLTFPSPSTQKDPPKQRAAKIMNAVFVLVRNSG